MTTKEWLTLIVTVLGLYLGPKIAVRLALKQFHEQKLWEKKVEIYQQLIGDMSVLIRFYDDAFMIALEGGDLSAGDKVKGAIEILERHSSAGGFVISQEAEKAIETALQAIRDRSYTGREDAYSTIEEALRSSTAIVKNCARKDCNLPS